MKESELKDYQVEFIEFLDKLPPKFKVVATRKGFMVIELPEENELKQESK